jgi:uncharacterized protein (TIGR02680 family)
LNQLLTDTLPTATRQPLPLPHRERWQPLRLGIVELFHYDSEEFWFRDGHLLLRGNNGTGKSKVLSLTLPFLFDAQLRPARIEPDGDSGKKMPWNLLMNSYPRRIGYTWIEFGQRTPEGEERFLTLGAGLSAVEGRPRVESWFFLLEGDSPGTDPRIGENFWLTSEQRVVFTRDRLSAALEGRGQVFENHAVYRRAVDERLFHLGTRRYDALMDTLIQLRQPQLSRRPDEAGLSHALTEALPPLPAELLGDIAEALNQLEEDRRQLDETRQLADAVKQFERRYRVYTGMLTRRQARELRQAQTAFDISSEERNKAQGALDAAVTHEADAKDALGTARERLVTARERLGTLQADPANADANRLQQASQDAITRKEEATTALSFQGQAAQALAAENQLAETLLQRREGAQEAAAAARAACMGEADVAGLASACAGNPLLEADLDQLAGLLPPELSSSAGALRDAAVGRRQQVRVVGDRLLAVGRARETLRTAEELLAERHTEQEEAAARRSEADQRVEDEAEALVALSTAYLQQLVELVIDADAGLDLLTAWAANPEGDNPLQLSLAEAYRNASLAHATEQARLDELAASYAREQEDLEQEQRKLISGQDSVPPPDPHRDSMAREQRDGAPFWRLVDFRAEVAQEHRAGLEAALESSGLLDAWVSAAGDVTDVSGIPLLDTRWSDRPSLNDGTLSDWLVADASAERVDAQLVERLLRGVRCSSQDDGHAEAWISVDGSFRLGVLAGAWRKTEAVYLGQTARARARERRIVQIQERLNALEREVEGVNAMLSALTERRSAASQELRSLPADQRLRQALLEVGVAQRELAAARARAEQAERNAAGAREKLQGEVRRLEADASDLRLPVEATALDAVYAAVEAFNDAQHHLLLTARELQNVFQAAQAQAERISVAEATLVQRTETATAAAEAARIADARLQVLQSSVGMKVKELQAQLRAAESEVRDAEKEEGGKQTALNQASETRAVAAHDARTAETRLEEKLGARSLAVEHLQRFVQSGLLSSALPEFALPEGDAPWTIDPALTLARRAEQALLQVADDEASWTRVQRQIAQDLTELQGSLGALGHQASSEPNDWGFSVHITYQNRPERPDRLATRLTDEISQRSELLSAKEREVLENHLQAEIASEVQRLMRTASSQVDAINEELKKRPTSTGVRFRLLWEPLTSEEGAPAGLDVARARLLNTSSDLWSVEDRRVIGQMLQAQIAAERARADTDAAAGASSLLDQLAHALDYRRWHRFRVQRSQDGQWRRLSGPASSGERALGLTVPLFAAIASFYGHGASRLAPRLMLLDEAFAGIDDLARSDCMGLIREFDLDFVITSEREWGCYATLPGVSICQLQRREGVDAVFVSRWTWDGQAKRRIDDPDRRFPPPTA